MMELGLVLLALYLLEGVRWVSLRSVALSRRPWGRWSARAPRRPRMTGSRGLLLPEPWAPALERYALHPWPLALSPEGILFPRSGDAASAPAGHDFTVVPWERASAIGAVGSRLRLERGHVAEAGSSRSARSFVDLLSRLSRQPPEAREAGIREALAAAFDSRQVRRRARLLRRAHRDTGLLAWLLTVNLFVTGPVLGSWLGSARVWPLWIALHLALTSLALAFFLRITRRLPAFAKESPTEIVVGLVLYPPSTARFLESTLPHAFDGLDPLAVVATLADRESFARTVRARLSGLHPRIGGCGIDEWYRTAVRERIDSLLAEAVGSGSAATIAPMVRETGAAAYCPRCGTQYRRGARTCADCPGVALVAHPDRRDP